MLICFWWNEVGNIVNAAIFQVQLTVFIKQKCKEVLFFEDNNFLAGNTDLDSDLNSIFCAKFTNNK